MSKVVDKSWTIAQVLQSYPEAREVFMQYGFMCLECPSSSLESLELGTRLHGIDTGEFIDALNQRLAEAKS
jgi:hybrid cluster-associated redox disulfide protein